MKKEKRVIIIDIDDMEDAYNDFNDNDISEDLQYYIEDQCSRTDSKDIIFKVITDNELSDKEKGRLVDTIRRHYGLDVQHAENRIKKNKQLNFIFFLIGVLFLIILSYVKNFAFFIPEVLDIIACLIIWESIYNLLFTDMEIDREVSLAKKIYKSRIEFKTRS